MNFNLKAAWQRVKPYCVVLDPGLLLILAGICGISLVVQYSAALDFPGRMFDHVRNFLLAFTVMWIVANVPPQTLLKVALPVYVLGVLLLVGVALFGDVSKGARRWLNLGGIRIQPSELLKIGLPLMLAWYFQQREAVLSWRDYIVAGIILAIPTVLILKQPDLGTATLVFAAGFFVIFFAGLSWRILALFATLFLASLPLVWTLMHDYQRQRVLTLLDPSSDPLGKGFHIIQSVIAVGSGGVVGKGWLQGTQTHLEFIPERTTDFIFSAYSEEFGLVGAVLLLFLYGALISRGLAIASSAPTLFARLLAAALTMIFFTYAFVNIGMVIGILPVVGVPLPFMSYGGTALLTLGIASGILMGIQRNRKLVPT
jgi:rod shape determining protein RodA